MRTFSCVVVLALLSACFEGSATAQIEKVMRDAQVRMEWAGYGLIEWDACGCDTAPAYPPDGFYAKVNDPACLAGNVYKALVAFQNLVTGITFYTSNQPSGQQWPSHYLPSDFPELFGLLVPLDVNEGNYLQVASQLSGAFAMLRYTAGGFSVEATEHLGKLVTGDQIDEQGCCPLVTGCNPVTRWNNVIDDIRATTSTPATSALLFARSGSAHCLVDPELCGAGGWHLDPDLYMVEERVNGEFTVEAPDALPGFYSGSNQLFLRLLPGVDGVVGGPPVTADGNWHQLGGSATTSDVTIPVTGPLPPITYPYPGQPPQCTDPEGEIGSKGWYEPDPQVSSGRGAITTWTFNATPDDEECGCCDGKPATVDPQPGASGSDGEGEDCDTGEDGGSGVKSTNPVRMDSGHKVEQVTDVLVKLPGRDFQILRQYSSQNDLYPNDPGIKGLVGHNWSLSVFREFTADGSGGGFKGYPIDASVTAFVPSGWSNKYRANGPTSRHIEETVVTIDGTSHQVWRWIEPGAWEIDFYRNPSDICLKGKILQERDIYGNVCTYEWDILAVIPSSPGEFTAQLARIHLNGTPQSASRAALVEFTWHSGTSTKAYAGRLANIGVYRFGTGAQQVLTNAVNYLYYDAADEPPNGTLGEIVPEATILLSPSLGEDGDLIQVSHSDLLDEGGEALPYRTRITQYRYHNGESNIESGNEPYLVEGEEHQLKAIITAEQLEFAAQAMIKTFNAIPPTHPVEPKDALVRAASHLLSRGDIEDVLDDGVPTPAIGTVLDFASKIVSYETDSPHRVSKQFLMASCGCSGAASQGLKQAFTYLGGTGWMSVQIADKRFIAGTYESSAYRTHHYDLVSGAGGIWYLSNRALQEGTGSKYWVHHFGYGTDDRMTSKATPAAKGSYTPASGGTAASYAAGSTGLIYEYGYTADNRRASVSVKNGSSGTPALVTRTNFPTSPGTNERLWLPTSTERFRVAGSTAANDVETTTYTYGFHGGTKPNALAWIKSSEERELESENGPASGGTVDTYELFDGEGLNRWSWSPDNALRYRKYDQANGELVKVIRNASASAPGGVSGEALNGSDYGGLTVTGWGTPTNGGELVTTYTLDHLGRVTHRVTPGSVNSYTLRELRTEDVAPEHEAMLYFTEVSLPHKLASSGADAFDGPAVLTWLSASNKALRSSDYSLDPAAIYVPLDGQYSLDDELARSTNVHAVSGLLSTRVSWHRLGTNEESYITSYKYDELGRSKSVTSPAVNPAASATGKHENSSYDVLDRVLEVKVGTVGGSMSTSAQHFYDSNGAASQGVGNGNLTYIRRYTGENGSLGADQRNTIRTYDFRDRLITVQNPTAPHEYMVYDNLGRIAERATFGSVPSAINNPLADRGLYAKSHYSQRGQMYKQQVAIDPTQLSPTYLETNTWFDVTGRRIAEWAPNSPGIKRTYDGHGRIVNEYTTDRGSDALPGASGNHADASALTDDRVVEQATFRYNASDRMDLVTRLVRIHDTSATGALTSSTGVATYTGYAFDAANRRVRTVEFGTNLGTSGSTDLFKTGGAAPTWPDASNLIPNHDTSGYEHRIVTGVAFNERGLTDFAIEPLGRKTKYFYDGHNRRVAVVENYVDTVVAWNNSLGRQEVTSGLSTAAPDTDRVTSYVYDGEGNVTKQVAHKPSGSGEAVQVTQYTYGVTAGSVGTSTDSLVHHSALLKETAYPDESLGVPGSTDAYKVKYSYNIQGELRSVTDQNGTVHVYTRDNSGRVTHDAVPTLGAGVNGWVRRIQVAYDTLGRMKDIESYDASSGGNVKNAVRFAYTSLWQVDKIDQDPTSALEYSSSTPTNDTRRVAYAYSNSVPASGAAGSNFSRITSMTLPFGTPQNYVYGSSGSIDDRLGRVAESTYGSGTPTSFLKYQFIGLGMAAEVDYPDLDVQLDFTLDGTGKRRTQGFTTGTQGEYPGYDRFGRTIRHAWVDGNLTTHASSTTVPNIPPIFAEGYTYDRASNRLTRTDIRPGASWADRDFEYSYDGLDRLTEGKRGSRNGGSMWTAGKLSQSWALDNGTALDMLGNWKKFGTDLDGDGTYDDPAETETRTHNEANELSSLTPAEQATVPFAYDDAGNVKTIGMKGYVHDAWNRLVRAESMATEPAAPKGEYEYYGLHWRSVARADTATVPDGVLNEKRTMYYDASWRVIEERVDDNYASSPGENRSIEQYWGTRYVDDAALRRVRQTSSGTVRSYHHLTDAMFSTRAMMGSGASITERVDYRAYGLARHHWKGDVDGDGDVDIDDSTYVISANIGDEFYFVEADLNRDGAVNATDLAQIGAGKAALPTGWISDGATADNLFGFDGYTFAKEIDSYHVRFRWYEPAMGRWLQRDPAGYVDGLQLYEYVNSAPIDFSDSDGLMKWGWKKRLGAIGGVTVTAGYAALMRLVEDSYDRTFKNRELSLRERRELESILKVAASCGGDLGDAAKRSLEILDSGNVTVGDSMRTLGIMGYTLVGPGYRAMWIQPDLIFNSIKEQHSNAAFARLQLLAVLLHESVHYDKQLSLGGSERDAYATEVDLLKELRDKLASGECGFCPESTSDTVPDLSRVLADLDYLIHQESKDGELEVHKENMR